MELYSFPTTDDGLKAIEEKVIELSKKYRDGTLEPLEDDWLQYANTVLDQMR